MSTTKKRMGDEGLRIDIPVTPIRKVKLFNDTKLKGGGGSAGKPLKSKHQQQRQRHTANGRTPISFRAKKTKNPDSIELLNEAIDIMNF